MAEKTRLLACCLLAAVAALCAPALAAPEHDASSIILYPKADSIVRGARPIVGADFTDLVQPGKELKPIIIVDGTDISSTCDIQSKYILCIPVADMAPGEHNVVLNLVNGRAWKAAEWKFTIGWQPPTRFMYPTPDQAVENPTPVIGMNFSEFPVALNPDTIKMYLDGRDISGEFYVTDVSVFFRPVVPLEDGVHRVVLQSRTSAGAKMEPISWEFMVGDGAAVAEKPRMSSSEVIASTGQRGKAIAEATREMETLYPEPAQEKPQEVTKVVYVTREEMEPQEPEEEKPSREEVNLAKQQYAEEAGLMLGTSYALETMAGYENMNLGGDFTRSSQLERSAFIHNIGLRTQTSVLSDSMKLHSFNINFKMTGTSDGDVNESFWDLKKLTATYVSEKNQMQMYDIRPKYTTYALSGKPLLGYQLDMDTGKNDHLNFFIGKFKKNTAGKHINLNGFRYTREDPDRKLSYGAHYLQTRIKQLRGGDTYTNSLYGFDVTKRTDTGETKFEWANSRYSEVGQDTAFKIENKYRKGKMYLQTGYEDVGTYFRSEAGFASKGLTEFKSSLQYQVSNRLTTVLGVKKRAFKEGGSKSTSIPFIAKLQPLKNRDSLNFEFKRQLVDYEKGTSTKDTTTEVFTFRDNFKSSQWTFSLKREKKERNDRSDENERLSNLKINRPLTEKLDFVYNLSKLSNNFYGPETTNTYTLSYELSDWSDVNFSLKTINKLNPYLDREARQLRFGMVDPENNTEYSFEFMQNRFIDYNETYSAFKYSKFF